MICRQIQEWLPLYWDFSEQDWRKHKIDTHLKHCVLCKQEFKVWEESQRMITDEFENWDQDSEIAQNVMSRIYADESWRMPTPERMYAFSFRVRRNLNLIVSFCLALFTISLLYSLLSEFESAASPQTTADTFRSVPVAMAPVDSEAIAIHNSTSIQGVPVASINDPLVWWINPMESYPDYLLFVSVIGLTASLIAMRWLARVKA